MAVVMRKCSGRLLKPDGLDNPLCGKPWLSFADSAAHQKGAGIGGNPGGWRGGQAWSCCSDGLSQV